MRKATRTEFIKAITSAGRIYTTSLPGGLVEYYKATSGESVLLGLLFQAGKTTTRYLAGRGDE